MLGSPCQGPRYRTSTSDLKRHAQHTAEQLSAARASEDFRRTLVDASLIVEDIRIIEGFTNDGVAQQMALYQESIARVPQTA